MRIFHLKLSKQKKGLKPCILKEWIDLNQKRFICPFSDFNNQIILFDDKLVHMGPENHESSPRISAEFTILAKY